MGLFAKSKVKDDNQSDSNETGVNLPDESEDRDYYIACMQSINDNIKEFSFDLKDIGAEKFKYHLDDLLYEFANEENEKEQDKIFIRYQKIIKAFIQRKKHYFDEKEDEFKNIVYLLTEGIIFFNKDNQEFNDSIFEHSSQLLDLESLDDIKKIKSVIKQEVGQIRNEVQVKSDNDAKRLKKLSQEVQVLRENLEKAETASMTDKLTGVYNRLAFDVHMKQRIDKFGVILSSFSIMMIDIDNFKSVNDTYGHLVGDKVIVETVNAAKANLRSDDFMARYGGEEFVIVLGRASLKNAMKMAEKVCRAIEKQPFVIDASKPDEILPFTVSIGVSSVRDGDSCLSIIDRADKALYQAKRTGKNKAVSEKELSAD